MHTGPAGPYRHFCVGGVRSTDDHRFYSALVRHLLDASIGPHTILLGKGLSGLRISTVDTAERRLGKILQRLGMKMGSLTAADDASLDSIHGHSPSVLVSAQGLRTTFSRPGSLL